MSVKDCRIIELPRINDPRGNLTFIESGKHVPFALKRIFYLYDVPGGATGPWVPAAHMMMPSNVDASG